MNGFKFTRMMLQGNTMRIFISIFAGLCLLTGCTRATQQQTTSESGQVPTAQPQLSPSPPAAAVSPTFQFGLATTSPTPAQAKQPPKPGEVNAAIARVFEKAATSESADNPSFIVGDFNGDGSEDLAVVVKPNDSSLQEINSELANWVLEDPKGIGTVQQDSAVQKVPPKPPPVHAQKGDQLLAVIHGVGSLGWRNPDAKQSYLLKNATGTNMVFQSAQDLRKSKDRQKMPTVRGDEIRETIEGRSGLLYWTGAKYGWYSPKLQ